MTPAGGIVLPVAAILASGWVLNLVRRGRLYVGYGIVILGLVSLVTFLSIAPVLRGLARSVLHALFPREPVAVVGLGALLVLLIYVLHQLSVLPDRVATLTQELAIRRAEGSPSGAGSDAAVEK